MIKRINIKRIITGGILFLILPTIIGISFELTTAKARQATLFERQSLATVQGGNLTPLGNKVVTESLNQLVAVKRVHSGQGDNEL